MKFLYKLEQKFGKFAIKNLSLILVIMYIAGYIIQYSNPAFIYNLTLDPYAILHGQVWRIVSWLLIPPPEGNIFFAIVMLMFYYSIGTTLERTWGTFQYNLYLFMGMLFTVLGSFLMMGYCYLFKPNLANPSIFFMLSMLFSTYYVNMSIFLAYASTFPDNTVLLMFVIPVKVKWLGFIYGGFLVYEMVSGMRDLSVFGLSFAYPFVIGASLLNFALFFFTTRKYIKYGHRQRRASNAYTKQQKQAEAFKKISKHKCAVCGISEKDNPDMQFRFCSKCDGNYEYCENHLYTHIHFTKSPVDFDDNIK